MSIRKPDTEAPAADSGGGDGMPARERGKGGAGCGRAAAESSEAEALIAAALSDALASGERGAFGSGKANDRAGCVQSAAKSGEVEALIAGARGSAGRAAAKSGDAWLAELLSDPGGPPDASKLTALQAELARPERRFARWPALLVWPLSGLAVIAVRAWIGDRSLFRVDLASAAPRLSWGVTVLAFCAACAVAAALHRGRMGFGLPSAFVRALSLALSALIALTPLWLRGAFPQPILHAFGAPCAGVVMIAGVLALGVTWWLFRRSQPVGASARALALGAATAAWTGIVISLHCPSESLMHLAWGHSLPLLGLVGLAAWLLPRQLQP